MLAALLGLSIEERYGVLSLTPQQQRTRTLQALVTQLIELSRNKPVLFVLEDAHWIDATTLELVDLCLDQVASARVMMLVTTRPTFQHGFGGHPIVTKLALNRLGRDQITSIVNRLTNGKTLPVRTARRHCGEDGRRAVVRRGDHQDGIGIGRIERNGLSLRTYRTFEPSYHPIDPVRFF